MAASKLLTSRTGNLSLIPSFCSHPNSCNMYAPTSEWLHIFGSTLCANVTTVKLLSWFGGHSPADVTQRSRPCSRHPIAAAVLEASHPPEWHLESGRWGSDTDANPSRACSRKVTAGALWSFKSYSNASH